MANIKEYDNPVAGLRPSETGVEAVSAAARRSGQFFREAAQSTKNYGRDVQQLGQETRALGGETAQVGDQNARNLGSAVADAGKVAVDYLDHQQVAQGAVAYAGMNDRLTNAWNDIVKRADPNDPTVADQFREQILEPELDKFKQSFWTEKSQQWAEGRVDALRNHMFEKTSADMGSLAADAVAVNVRQSANHLTNTAMADPSSVSHLLESVDASVGAIVDTSPNLKGAAAAKVRMQLTEQTKEAVVKAGAIGAIRSSQNPEAAAAAWSSKYPDYINGAEVKQLADAARQQLRFIGIENRANQAEARRKQQEDFHKEANQFEVSTTTTDDGGRVVDVTPPNARDQLTKLSSMPGADPGRVAALTNRLVQIGNRQDDTTRINTMKRSDATQADLFRRSTEDGSTVGKEDFRKAYVDGNLTWPALKQLEANYDADHSATGETIAARRKEFIMSHEGALDPARMVANVKSPNGSIAIDKYSQWLRGQEEDYRKNGKNPQDLYAYNKDGVSPADAGIKMFSVPIKDLAGNIQKLIGVDEVPDVPAEMPYEEILKKYPGRQIRVNGKMKQVPNG